MVHVTSFPDSSAATVLRRRRFFGPRAIAVALTITTLIATACLPTTIARAGDRCSGANLARDNTHILECQRGRWVRTKTTGQFVTDLANLVRAAQERDAEAARLAGVSQRAWTMRGTGTWVDVWDWSPTFLASKGSSASPGFTLSRIDRMADNGISTLYIQTARAELADPVLDRALLQSIIAKARSRGMRVIGWYLPTFADPAADRAHIAATVDLGVDGFGMDIEATTTELALRNQRLVELSVWTRTTYPNLPLAAIVLPPVVTDVINLNFWPNFPWRMIATSYDVWMPMSYWTNRTTASGWRDGYRYTAENIDRVRANLGLPNAAIHAIGGLSNETAPEDIDRFVWAAAQKGSIGASLYDDLISSAEQYRQLAPMAR